ncbi:hypothetical protein FBULB1_8091 [Fusarium bulbicola]|nr:hypothetical protein FBULB1_8091 [Fusarium bulbicola]
MFPGQRKRGWRQCLADSYEKNHGPLDDPVPTFGAKLVTFPSTPTLPMCFATPDPDFLEELDRRLCAVEAKPVPKCLQPLRFDEPEPVVELSCSDNDTDDEGSESFRNSMREARIRVYASAGIDTVAVEAKRRARKLAREKRREARATESNNTKCTLPSSHDHATKPSSTAEADNAEYQAKHQKRKRQTEDGGDEPHRKIARPSDTTSPRPERLTRPSFKPQASYSPPQTPSPTGREHAQGQTGSSSSPESLVAQQPTPEGDSYLKLGRESLTPPDRRAPAIAVEPSRKASRLLVSAARTVGYLETTSTMSHWSIGAITAPDEDADISWLFFQHRWRDAVAGQRRPAGNNALDEAQEPWLWEHYVSPALDTMVNGNFQESQECSVKWDDVDEIVFNSFWQFVYTGDYDTPEPLPTTQKDFGQGDQKSHTGDKPIEKEPKTELEPEPEPEPEPEAIEALIEAEAAAAELWTAYT